jgi:hypothetical protein
VRKKLEEWQREWTAAQKDKHIMHIDGGLPAKNEACESTAHSRDIKLILSEGAKWEALGTL